MSRKVLIAIGSNYKRASGIKCASKELSKLLKITSFSAMYSSQSVNGGPKYLNLVIAAETDLSADILKIQLKLIEKLAGRIENTQHNCVLDLDLLFYEGVTIQGKLPHPDLFDKPYVVIPVSEIIGIDKYSELNKVSRVDFEFFRSKLNLVATSQQVRFFFDKLVRN